jgi:stage III sporulation protein AH
MMLKKQTVWLLTMLSLVVVLSVYYITAEPTLNDVADGDRNQKEESQTETIEETSDTTITQVSKDEVFEEIRLQMQDERSMKLEELQQVAGSTELPAEERSGAKDEMNRIHQVAEKEKLIESLIVQTLGYEDALVQADGGEVTITVKGQEPSKAKANEIIKIVKKEIGNSFVTVAFEDQLETK